MEILDHPKTEHLKPKVSWTREEIQNKLLDLLETHVAMECTITNPFLSQTFAFWCDAELRYYTYAFDSEKIFATDLHTYLTLSDVKRVYNWNTMVKEAQK